MYDIFRKSYARSTIYMDVKPFIFKINVKNLLEQLERPTQKNPRNSKDVLNKKKTIKR